MTRIILPAAALPASYGFSPPIDGLLYYNVFDNGRRTVARKSITI